MANTTGKKFGGRKKGTPNKNTQELMDMILETGCPHPVQGMAQIAVQAKEEGNIDLAQACYKELAQYVAPKRKAIEHSGNIETDNQFVIVVPDVTD